MSRKLNDLTPQMYDLACKLIAHCAEQGIPIMIIDTLRTPAEQETNIKKGVSWTKNSKHLPGEEHRIKDDVIGPLDMHLVVNGYCTKPRCEYGKSRAIDVCPYSVFQLDGPDKLAWDSDSPVWEQIGRIGEGLGLRWGGRWTKQDMGHFELS